MSQTYRILVERKQLLYGVGSRELLAAVLTVADEAEAIEGALVIRGGGSAWVEWLSPVGPHLTSTSLTEHHRSSPGSPMRAMINVTSEAVPSDVVDQIVQAAVVRLYERLGPELTTVVADRADDPSAVFGGFRTDGAAPQVITDWSAVLPLVLEVAQGLQRFDSLEQAIDEASDAVESYGEDDVGCVLYRMGVYGNLDLLRRYRFFVHAYGPDGADHRWFDLGVTSIDAAQSFARDIFQDLEQEYVDGDGFDTDPG